MVSSTPLMTVMSEGVGLGQQLGVAAEGCRVTLQYEGITWFLLTHQPQLRAYQKSANLVQINWKASKIISELLLRSDQNIQYLIMITKWVNNR